MPQNAITPSVQHNERNSCPIHCNMRRMVKAANKFLKRFQLEPLPVSTRELCLKSMCSSEGVNINPLSWNYECASGKCQACPSLQVELKDEIQSAVVSFSQWGSKPDHLFMKGKVIEKRYTVWLRREKH